MNNLKKGNKLIATRRNLPLQAGEVYTFCSMFGDRIKVLEFPRHNFDSRSLKLVVDERKEVEDAMAVFEKHGLLRSQNGNYGLLEDHEFIDGLNYGSSKYVLDGLFPPPLSSEQIKLAELQEQIKTLQSTATELQGIISNAK